MINLLPPEEKQRLMQKKRQTLAVVLGSMALVGIVAFILILYALEFYLLSYSASQKDMAIVAEKKYETAEVQMLKKQIAYYNTVLVNADQFYKKTLSMNDALGVLYRIPKPVGLTLDTVVSEYSVEGKMFKVNITGKSVAREDLLAFKKNMEESGRVKHVYIPPGSWVKAKNISFEATFEIVNKSIQ